MILASGGDFVTGMNRGRTDMATPYLRDVLRFIGLRDPRFVLIGPTVGPAAPAQAAREAAHRKLQSSRRGFDGRGTIAAPMPKTEEVGMDDVDGQGQVHQLHGWTLAPESAGALKLVLQFDPGPDPGSDCEGLVQLLLPPEAALHLAGELSRQAQRCLEKLPAARPDRS